MDNTKSYIGDGVYVSFDGWQLCLETERSDGTERIYLEPAVWESLVDYVERLKAVAGAQKASE